MGKQEIKGQKRPTKIIGSALRLFSHKIEGGVEIEGCWLVLIRFAMLHKQNNFRRPKFGFKVIGGVFWSI